ncbi:MAG: crossover junction endodeoxyribonuclease RuvC [Acidimicrobiia bacterium]|nr:crossover junction endodeoxyribonuclease RuvC [Acidimicrobiia bacterium]
MWSTGHGRRWDRVVRVFVLGVDPGLSRCGYAVVAHDRGSTRAVAIGVVRTDPADPVARRLAQVQQSFRALMAEHRPVAVAVERVLFGVNVRTAMSVGQASGVVMAEAAGRGAEVVEYSPNEVKAAVGGWGGAPKDQVGEMVRVLLGLDAVPRPADAADAAAVALCHVAVAGGPLAGAGRGGGAATITAERLAPVGGAVRNRVRRRPETPGNGDGR